MADLSDLEAIAEESRLTIAMRDAVIRKLHTDGESLRVLAAATGLSHGTIANIVKR